jgi:ubiquinone/menaquinone biosynthesis C-methylase UbiE
MSMAEMWDGVADAWERHTEFFDGQMAAATTALLDTLQITTGQAVLEVACGPGSLGIAAGPRVGDSGRVVMADVAPAMVAVAARRAASLPWASTAVFDQDDIDAPDDSFDAVVSRHGLMFTADPAVTVREACRVLKPGAGYGAIVWDAREANPWLGAAFDAVSEQFGVPFPPEGVRGPFSLDDPGLLEAALRDGGLRDVQVTRIATPMRRASVEDWWETTAQLAGPLTMALASMEPDVRDAIVQRAIANATAASRATDDGIELDGSVLVGTGRRP